MSNKDERYSRQLGTRTIYGTDWPVEVKVKRFGKGRWEVIKTCSGTGRVLRKFSTFRDALEFASTCEN